MSCRVYLQLASTHLPEVSGIPRKSLISRFRCVWLGLELNSAGLRPSRTVSADSWSRSASWLVWNELVWVSMLCIASSAAALVEVWTSGCYSIKGARSDLNWDSLPAALPCAHGNISHCFYSADERSFFLLSEVNKHCEREDMWRQFLLVALAHEMNQTFSRSGSFASFQHCWNVSLLQKVGWVIGVSCAFDTLFCMCHMCEHCLLLI